MRLRLKHLLWANAFVAVYLGLCRAGAWALSYRNAEGIRGWVGTIVQFCSIAALIHLLEYTCGRIFRGRGPLMKGEFLEFRTLVAISLIAGASIIGAHAWFNGIPLP
jgi:hypothetical protein